MSTKENFSRALANEALNRELYLAFAEKAQSEGQDQLAKVFRASAESELVHARAQMHEMDLIGSAEDNLRYAVAAEEREFQDNYAAYLHEAREEGDERAAELFARFLKVERAHYKMFSALLAVLTKGKDLPENSIYVCPTCGNTVLENRPTECEICGGAGADFMDIA